MPAKPLTKEQWQELKNQQKYQELFPEDAGSDWRGLVFRPKNTSFATQDPDEQVFIMLRRHWITNTSWVINSVLYGLLPLIVLGVARFFNQDLWQLFGLKVVTIILLTYYSLVITNIYRHIADWYFNLYIVTNRRVLDYDFKIFTSSGAVESALENIEDVKQKSIGFLPNLFNYGELEVFSSADRNVIKFTQVPDPTTVRDRITDLARLAKEQLHDNE